MLSVAGASCHCPQYPRQRLRSASRRRRRRPGSLHTFASSVSTIIALLTHSILPKISLSSLVAFAGLYFTASIIGCSPEVSLRAASVDAVPPRRFIAAPLPFRFTGQRVLRPMIEEWKGMKMGTMCPTGTSHPTIGRITLASTSNLTHADVDAVASSLTRCT